MQKPRFSPSPALVVAVLALALAVVGTAVAGPPGFERALSKSKVKAIARKQANRQIGRRAPDLTVASANPVAFAHVLADGTVDAANSKAVAAANVANGATAGYYCFSGLAFQPRGGTATVDRASTGPIDTIALLGLGAGTECPAGTQFFVDTRYTDTTGSVKTAFFVSAYR